MFLTSKSCKVELTMIVGKSTRRLVYDSLTLGQVIDKLDEKLDAIYTTSYGLGDV